MSLSKEDIERVKFTFSIYDFDGSNKIDAFQLGNALRALGLNPTLKKISNLGGTIRRNEKTLTVEEFLAIYQEAKQDKDGGTMEDYMECLKSHDKDGSGKLSVAQLGHLLLAYGEKLDRDEVEEIINDCGSPDEDLVDYQVFIKNLLNGPENRTTTQVPKRNTKPETTATSVDPPKPKEIISEHDNLTLPTSGKNNITVTSLPERSASSDKIRTSDTSGGDTKKAVMSPKTGKARNSSIAPETKNEPPPVKAKFQQPLISLKTDGLFGKRK